MAISSLVEKLQRGEITKAEMFAKLSELKGGGGAQRSPPPAPQPPRSYQQQQQGGGGTANTPIPTPVVVPPPPPPANITTSYMETPDKSNSQAEDLR